MNPKVPPADDGRLYRVRDGKWTTLYGENLPWRDAMRRKEMVAGRRLTTTATMEPMEVPMPAGVTPAVHAIAGAELSQSAELAALQAQAIAAAAASAADAQARIEAKPIRIVPVDRTIRPVQTRTGDAPRDKTIKRVGQPTNVEPETTLSPDEHTLDGEAYAADLAEFLGAGDVDLEALGALGDGMVPDDVLGEP